MALLLRGMYTTPSLTPQDKPHRLGARIAALYHAGMQKISFTGKLFRWSGDMSSWYFVYLPKDLSTKLRALPRAKKRGFNSIKVRAKIGTTEWDTSLFPTKEGPYLIAVKKSVRLKEGIDDGDSVKMTCVLV